MPAGETLGDIDELELEDDDLEQDLLDEDDFVGDASRASLPARSRKRSTPSSSRKSARRSRKSRSSSARWACGRRPKPEEDAATNRPRRTIHARPRARQTADPGDLSPRRRSARPGHQGEHRHQGADPLDLHQHPRPISRAHAGTEPRRRLAQDRRRRPAPQAARDHARAEPAQGTGFIVRTAGLERTKRELARDLAYLLRLWKVILRRIKKSKAPTPIYQESDMIIRTIRDIFNSEIDTIWIDEPSAFERAQDFLRVVMPRFVNRLKLYDEKVPLFHKYGIEDEIAKIQRRHVPLPEGGSIVIDQTEALVAIDVNSGNFRVEDDAERTAYEMNLRAAKEIARQLRLRDLGGVIVNDFIDMREERHRRGVERALREAIKRDRARTKVLRMSAFGLIEMTRQRIRPSLKRSIYEDCPHCAGAGVAKTAESMAIDVMRLLALATHREEIRRIVDLRQSQRGHLS